MGCTEFIGQNSRKSIIKKLPGAESQQLISFNAGSSHLTFYVLQFFFSNVGVFLELRNVFKNYMVLDGIQVNGNSNWIIENTSLGNGAYDLDDRGAGNWWWRNVYDTASWE